MTNDGLILSYSPPRRCFTKITKPRDWGNLRVENYHSVFWRQWSKAWFTIQSFLLQCTPSPLSIFFFRPSVFSSQAREELREERPERSFGESMHSNLLNKTGTVAQSDVCPSSREKVWRNSRIVTHKRIDRCRRWHNFRMIRCLFSVSVNEKIHRRCNLGRVNAILTPRFNQFEKFYDAEYTSSTVEWEIL